MKLVTAALVLVTMTALGAAPQDMLPPYQRMDYGPALFWTYQVAPGNIAQKGIAVRLDDSPSGFERRFAAFLQETPNVAALAASFADYQS